MKDQNIYEQAILEIVVDPENDFLNAGDIRRIANLAEKFYRQGFEDATIEKQS